MAEVTPVILGFLLINNDKHHMCLPLTYRIHSGESIPFDNIEYLLKVKPFCSDKYARAFAEGTILGILPFTPFKVISRWDRAMIFCVNTRKTFENMKTTRKH